MEKDTLPEQWNEVNLGNGEHPAYRLQVSDLGHLRTFNQHRKGTPLRGTNINGYRIVRIALRHPISSVMKDNLQALQQQIRLLKVKRTGISVADAARLIQLQTKLSMLRKKDLANRRFHFQALFHRMVAEAFLVPASPKHTVVGHLDHDKQNNHVSNLKWMTAEENYQHQQCSPLVITEKQVRVTIYKNHPRNASLTVKQVSQIKQELYKGVRLNVLAKKYKISSTQVTRIQKGLNWGHVIAEGSTDLPSLQECLTVL